MPELAHFVQPASTLTFLGSSDSKGVPRFWCNCPVCQEARSTGHNRRTRTGFLLRHERAALLLDASADLHGQLSRLPTPLIPEVALFSHAHNDHVLGLGDLLDLGRYEGHMLSMYAPHSVLPALAQRFPYAFASSSPVTALPTSGLNWRGWHIQLFEVPHGANGTSHAYHLSNGQFRAALVTDALDIPAQIAQSWLGNLDLLVLGTSFWDESGANLPTGRSVYDVRQALALPWAQAAGQVILTHLSHDIDTATPTHLPPGWRFAHDGLNLVLTL